MQTTTPMVNGVPIRAANLLVSVQNESELQVALRAGVRWIDVKDPSRGPLGRPEKEVATAISSALANTNDRHFSIALGELCDTTIEELLQFASSFAENTVFKIALSDCLNRDDWVSLTRSLANGIGAPNRFILVHYADAKLASAPPWNEVLQAAAEIGSKYLLIDTFEKKGRRLLDYYSVESLQQMICDANDCGLRVAIAGSLRLEDVEQLASVGADWIGVRGAVCEGPLRTGAICEAKVNRALTLLREKCSDCFIETDSDEKYGHLPSTAGHLQQEFPTNVIR